MRALKDFIHGLKAAQSSEGTLDDKTVFYLFRTVVREHYGSIGEQEMEPVAYSDGILSVRTKNPLWASELWMKREPFLQSLNQRIGSPMVKDLKMVRFSA